MATKKKVYYVLQLKLEREYVDIKSNDDIDVLRREFFDKQDRSNYRIIERIDRILKTKRV